MRSLVAGIAAMTVLMDPALAHLDRLAQPKPPPEAIDACRVLDEGAACTVIRPGEKTAGTCRTLPVQTQRFCVPNSMGPMAGPRIRRHTTVQSDGTPVVRPANVLPITESRVVIRLDGSCRILTTNGIARHNTGPFPNDRNPNGILEQAYSFCLPSFPEPALKITPLGLGKFGMGLNGVPFDPGAAEFYLGNPRGGWQYEAMSGALDLGFDENHAHVQFTGAYHYHGLPKLYLDGMRLDGGAHSPLVGWAADGFPIYAVYGWSDQEDERVEEMVSGYRLKQGQRPKSDSDPGGTYDGTFINDYEYVAGAGTLDKCNGRFTRTPEFPDGTYAYFLTNTWPVIPRCFKGTPLKEFITPDLPPGARLPG